MTKAPHDPNAANGRQGGPAVRVLLSVKPPGQRDNPYATLLVRNLNALDGVEVAFFSWRRALIGTYDVLHIQWPEAIVRARTPLRSTVAQLLTAALLVRLRLQRRVTRRPAIVRTVHNLHPHEEGSRFEASLLRQLDVMTDSWITLNAHSDVPAGARRSLVPHGHYRDWYTMPSTDRSSASSTVLYFGLIRSYKGVDVLLRAFSEVPASSDMRLAVLGDPGRSEQDRSLLQAIAADDRISAELRHIPDDRLVEAITDAELVVLPYRKLHNSGAVLLALSCNTPVLVPENPVTRDLQEEFGPDWVITYAGDLAADDLERAHALVSSARPQHLDLSGRAWDKSAVDHREVYQAALGRT